MQKRQAAFYSRTVTLRHRLCSAGEGSVILLRRNVSECAVRLSCVAVFCVAVGKDNCYCMAEKKQNDTETVNQKKQTNEARKPGSKNGQGKVPAKGKNGSRKRTKAAVTENSVEEQSVTVEKQRSAASGKRRGGRSAKGAERKHESTLFDFPDITPDDEDLVSVNDASNAAYRGTGSAKGRREEKLRIIPLGGLGEIGKNMMAVEFGQDIVVIDCGMGFPEEDMPGIDLVIPDISYLISNREKVRGILLTHGHEDHIGAVPYVLKQMNVPIYGTALTLGIIKYKLSEHHLDFKPQLISVKAGDKVKLGVFEAEFIHVNHSIADSCAIALNTPRGLIVHSGDFKLDVTPIEGEMMDLTRFGELGRKGVKLLMCESTNAERGGFTPSEKSVGGTLENLFTANPDKRIVIATFSSNVHRVQQIIDISIRHGRRVALTGRSMLNVVSAACELGYMHFPEGTLVDIGDIKRFRPGDLTLITTGSQGEPMSALYRMAYGGHAQVTLTTSDLVVLSSSAIPGNEKFIGRIINELSRAGIKVVTDSSIFGLHASGHACGEEIKLLQMLLKPKYYMPIHGEYRHLAANRELAIFTGIPADHIFTSDIGRVLEIGRTDAAFAGTVPSGKVLIDGYGVGDVGRAVLRDRQHLSQDGMVIVFASVDLEARLMLTSPEIVSRGFVYVPESEELLADARDAASAEIRAGLSQRKADIETMKERVRREVAKCLSARTGRNPMVIPVIIDL